jgi:hypothetical protein
MDSDSHLVRGRLRLLLARTNAFRSMSKCRAICFPGYFQTDGK